MDDQQQFCLRWNDFQTNMVASFKHLRDEKSFCDVTLACDGQSCKAHKMILSACSPYFKALLEENPAKHPIIILKDVPFQHLTAILEFMYAGEVNVAQVRNVIIQYNQTNFRFLFQDQLPQFLKTAERLKVKGLAEAPQSVKDEQRMRVFKTNRSKYYYTYDTYQLYPLCCICKRLKIVIRSGSQMYQSKNLVEKF